MAANAIKIINKARSEIAQVRDELSEQTNIPCYHEIYMLLVCLGSLLNQSELRECDKLTRIKECDKCVNYRGIDEDMTFNESIQYRGLKQGQDKNKTGGK